MQGEGVRAGTANIFVRFTGCNMKCDLKEGPQSPGGFACDTEFASGRSLTLEGLNQYIDKMCRGADCNWLILTGGEPALQVDKEFCDFFHDVGYKLAIETNGSIELPQGVGTGLEGTPQLAYRLANSYLDWITVSPKVAEHAIKQTYAHEVKYVRGYGQGIPKTVVEAQHYLLSPAFAGNELDNDTLQWCIKLCLDHPQWRLSLQQHKQWKVR